MQGDNFQSFSHGGTDYFKKVQMNGSILDTEYCMQD